MIGDAAHATSPFIGQGAAQALEDAAVLSHVLPLLESRGDVATAFQAFENVRKERSQKIVEGSRLAGKIYHFEVDDIPGADPNTAEGIEVLKNCLGGIGAFANEMDVDKQNQSAIDQYRRLMAKIQS
jgi:salicylate hydroxylase